MLSKLRTYQKLGINNILAVAKYRLALKRGRYKKLCPIGESTFKPDTEFLRAVSLPTIDAPSQLKGFGWLSIDEKNTPNWFAHIVTGEEVTQIDQHWSDIGDFSLNIGDIKAVWELSRFDWAPYFAACYRAGDKPALIKLNQWLTDWANRNPANLGINWKCGQEASIRVMHLASAAYLLGQCTKLESPLANFIEQHLTRIAPSIEYAMAQDNNHGTSEAAALFIGASLLLEQPEVQNSNQLKNWQNTGRRWLENRAKYLVDVDGAFSQHSTNYHRLMLDTLSLVEFFRQHLNLPPLSAGYYDKCKKALNWLYLHCPTGCSKGPMLGLNDGAKLLPIFTTDRNDMRSSIHWACVLYNVASPYEGDTEIGKLAASFTPTIVKAKISELNNQLNFISTSYHAINKDLVRAYVRTPNNKFRPSACDLLHLDMWFGDKNVFVSPGSYSYNCEPALQAYFTSAVAHNTVQFDDKEPMQKLSRFLYSDWVSATVNEHTDNSLSTKIITQAGNQHRRDIVLADEHVTIEDNIDNIAEQAILRWHLGPGNWQLKNNIVCAEDVEILISSDTEINDIRLVTAEKSSYYLQKETIQVIEVLVNKACTITTKVNLIR